MSRNLASVMFKNIVIIVILPKLADKHGEILLFTKHLYKIEECFTEQGRLCWKGAIVMEIKRLDFLDAAKGIGIILVVAGHVIGEGDKPFLWSNTIQGWIYSFHTALFFIIAGMLQRYLLRNRDITLKDVKKKSFSFTKRLLIPYFIWSILYFVIDNKEPDADTCKDWLYVIFTFRGKAPVWFLGALFWALLFAIIIIWISKQKTPLVFVSAIVCIAIVIFISRHYDLSIIEPLPLQYLAVSASRGILCLAFVLMGYLLLPLLLLEKPLYTNIICWIISLAFSIILYSSGGYGNFHTFTIHNSYTYILTGLFGSLGVVFFCKTICSLVNLRLLQHIGRADTLGIMCIHYTHLPFMRYASDICNGLRISGFLAFAVSFIFVFGVSLLLTEVFIRVKLV